MAAKVATSRILRTDDFREALFADLELARAHIELQFMTFEGDRAGWRVANSLIRQAQRGVRVRVLIDYFSSYYLSDQPAIYPARWREWWSTHRMFRAMRRAGIELRRPGKLPTPSVRRLLQLNHKKIVVIDEVSYLGGVNISDHNFAWHDFMVRSDGVLTQDLLADFNATWYGQIRAPQGDLLHSGQLRYRLPQLIEGAEEEVILSSPYFWDLVTVRMLARVAQAGRRVIVLTPPHINIAFVRLGNAYLLYLLQKSGASVRIYDRFSHAKYLIVDRADVLFGSANLGYFCYHITEELCLHTREPALVRAFINDLFWADWRHTRPAPRVPRPPRSGRLACEAYLKFMRYLSRPFPTYGLEEDPSAQKWKQDRQLMPVNHPEESTAQTPGPRPGLPANPP